MRSEGPEDPQAPVGGERLLDLPLMDLLGEATGVASSSLISEIHQN